MLRKERELFFTALMFYTRIPVPGATHYSDRRLNEATRYFPFIGWIVGAFGGLLFQGMYFLFPASIAILISMAGTIWITGAFHEDGFADFCDGFGGGYTGERILDIMKDSRIGTYGSAGLFLVLLLKFLCLSHLPASHMILFLLTGHSFSRLFPVILIYTSAYVRKDAESKSKPVGRKGSLLTFGIALVWGVTWLCFLPWKVALLVVVATIPVFFFFKRYVEKKIGGYTGDVLGAFQQITEIVTYLAVLVYYRHPV